MYRRMSLNPDPIRAAAERASKRTQLQLRARTVCSNESKNALTALAWLLRVSVFVVALSRVFSSQFFGPHGTAKFLTVAGRSQSPSQSHARTSQTRIPFHILTPRTRQSPQEKVDLPT